MLGEPPPPLAALPNEGVRPTRMVTAAPLPAIVGAVAVRAVRAPPPTRGRPPAIEGTAGPLRPPPFFFEPGRA